jgi:hypothetical protein
LGPRCRVAFRYEGKYAFIGDANYMRYQRALSRQKNHLHIGTKRFSGLYWVAEIGYILGCYKYSYYFVLLMDELALRTAGARVFNEKGLLFI